MSSLSLDEMLRAPQYASLLAGARLLDDAAAADDDDAIAPPAPPIEDRGIALGFLIVLTDALALAPLPTHRVVSDVIKPLTAARRCRFTQLRAARPFVGRARTCVLASHSPLHGRVAPPDGVSTPRGSEGVEWFSSGGPPPCISSRALAARLGLL